MKVTKIKIAKIPQNTNEIGQNTHSEQLIKAHKYYYEFLLFIISID